MKFVGYKITPPSERVEKGEVLSRLWHVAKTGQIRHFPGGNGGVNNVKFLRLPLILDVFTLNFETLSDRPTKLAP